MKLLLVLAATAVAAAVAAALSIAAGANPSAGDRAAKLAACVRAHGAAACQPRSAAAPAALVACLRARGLNPPANLFLLKPWMVRQDGTVAGKAALSACRVSFDSPASADTGKDVAACLRSHGADVPAGADGLALKTWVRDHASDAKVTDALERCAGGAEKPPRAP
jgi:hypothetical protein